MSCVLRGKQERVWETLVLRWGGGTGAVAEVDGTRQEGGRRQG